jgi:hypothetical protein
MPPLKILFVRFDTAWAELRHLRETEINQNPKMSVESLISVIRNVSFGIILVRLSCMKCCIYHLENLTLKLRSRQLNRKRHMLDNNLLYCLRSTSTVQAFALASN